MNLQFRPAFNIYRNHFAVNRERPLETNGSRWSVRSSSRLADEGSHISKVQIDLRCLISDCLQYDPDERPTTDEALEFLKSCQIYHKKLS